ncbi:ABC transporter ATP-binding protein [Actinomadura sp. 6N118]|uniref:ABC transporter ATP-binding protein n=1 Tax=Actinomadura sp. 6N118 TaxID=3375151 RepID=UPI0037B17787
MIETKGLHKRYRGITAVDDLSFTAPAGQVTGFLGPNGAGKTTTMRIVLGLERATSGSATIDGRPLREHAAPQRVVGAVLEAGGAPAGMTARAHLRWLAAAGRIPDTRADDVLEQVGLAPVATRRIAALSLGMRQRLGIAAALLGDPAALILDEPVNGLDPDGVRWARHLRPVLLGEHSALALRGRGGELGGGGGAGIPRLAALATGPGVRDHLAPRVVHDRDPAAAAHGHPLNPIGLKKRNRAGRKDTTPWHVFS